MAISKLNTLILDIASGLRIAVPQALLAEVVPQQTMEPPAPSSEAWLLGFLDWREEQVPVVDPGVICGRGIPETGGIHRYGVLYALENIVGLSYYAVPLAAIPHPVRVGPEDVVAQSSPDGECSAVASTARVEEQAVIIPDLPYIEKIIEEHLTLM